MSSDRSFSSMLVPNWLIALNFALWSCKCQLTKFFALWLADRFEIWTFRSLIGLSLSILIGWWFDSIRAFTGYPRNVRIGWLLFSLILRLTILTTDCLIALCSDWLTASRFDWSSPSWSSEWLTVDHYNFFNISYCCLMCLSGFLYFFWQRQQFT